MSKVKHFSKKIITAILLAMVCSWANAQKIALSEIEYWVGSGTNEAIFIANFCGGNTALAWGYRFNGSVTAQTMIDAIVAADSRLSNTAAGGLGVLNYTDNVYGSMTTDPNGVICWYNVNDAMANVTTAQIIVNGDIVEAGGNYCATMDWGTWEVSWTLPVVAATDPNAQPVTYTIIATSGDYGTITPSGANAVAEGGNITFAFAPNAGYRVGQVMLGGTDVTGQVSNNTFTISNVVSDSTISVLFAVNKNNAITASDILYWVGTGTNEVILAINWCDPEIAFAWGYRFNGNSVSVSDVLNAIKTADSRFDFAGSSYLTDITYVDANYNLAISPDWVMYNVNEEAISVGIDAQQVYNGDVIEFGCYSTALTDDFWANVWTTAITPVTPLIDGIYTPNNVELVLYPNPATDELRIKNAECKINSVEITDITGKSIYHSSSIINNSIDVSSLAQGTYLLKIQTDNGLIVKNFIKK